MTLSLIDPEFILISFAGVVAGFVLGRR